MQIKDGRDNIKDKKERRYLGGPINGHPDTGIHHRCGQLKQGEPRGRQIGKGCVSSKQATRHSGKHENEQGFHGQDAKNDANNAPKGGKGIARLVADIEQYQWLEKTAEEDQTVLRPNQASDILTGQNGAKENQRFDQTTRTAIACMYVRGRRQEISRGRNMGRRCVLAAFAVTVLVLFLVVVVAMFDIQFTPTTS